jgi:MFS family permease
MQPVAHHTDQPHKVQASILLLLKRRFLPLFVTQSLGAFNDNLFKTAMVILVTYHLYQDPAREASFTAIAGGLFILPFFLFSALAGQLADAHDKARIIRIIKTAEIVIMIAGALGLLLGWITLLLLALFAMGVHSSFFGPIKYAILPQHLHEDEVLGGTGLVEAGTYVAVLAGTIAGGIIPATTSAALVLALALVGRMSSSAIPRAKALAHQKIDFNVCRSSIRLVSATLHVPRLFQAILAVSAFWAMAAVLASLFPPLVKNTLGANREVATLFLALFSVGVAIGSILINRLLAGEVSARFAPAAAIIMGLFIIDLQTTVNYWPPLGGTLDNVATFIRLPHAERVMIDLLGVAIAGGMFVVPLYAFLTTTVKKSETARTVAANNIVNSGAMVLSTLVTFVLVQAGVSVANSLLLVAVLSVAAAWLAWQLHLACD